MGAPAFFISFFAGRRKNAILPEGVNLERNCYGRKPSEHTRHSRPGTAGAGAADSREKPQVIKWRGALSVSIAELELDGTVKAMLTIGKSSVPETIDGLPTA